VPRTSIEHVLPSAWVARSASKTVWGDANACLNSHFTAQELAGKPQPDHHHWHEHATRFRWGDRGLVLIGSYGHVGPCISGPNFVDLPGKEMPEKLVLCGTGSSFTFTT
jgi:hypothetical protein